LSEVHCFVVFHTIIVARFRTRRKGVRGTGNRTFTVRDSTNILFSLGATCCGQNAKNPPHLAGEAR
jgi:hypothetical protein